MRSIGWARLMVLTDFVCMASCVCVCVVEPALDPPGNFYGGWVLFPLVNERRGEPI